MSQSGFTPIITYNTATASAAPSAGNLTQGELAVNVTDKKIYTKNAGGTVVQVGAGPDATETLTNKTLTTPVLANPSYSGTTANGGTVTTIDINGGTIDATAIGSTTPAAGSFTTLSASGSLSAGVTTVGSGNVEGLVAKFVGWGENTLSIKNYGTGSYPTRRWDLCVDGDGGSGGTEATNIKLYGSGSVEIPGPLTSGIHTISDGVSPMLKIGYNADGGTDNVFQIRDQSNGVNAIQITPATGAVTIPGGITQESVIAPTLLNSWVNYGGTDTVAGYWKDTLGVVHLRGAVKSGTAVDSYDFFVLPSGYRPSETVMFAVVSNGALGTLSISVAGAVTFRSGSNTKFNFDGITFRAA